MNQRIDGRKSILVDDGKDDGIQIICDIASTLRLLLLALRYYFKHACNINAKVKVS